MDRLMINKTDALTSKLLQAADAQREAGDTDAALLMSDAADGLLVLLDHDAARRTADQGDAGSARKADRSAPIPVGRGAKAITQPLPWILGAPGFRSRNWRHP